MFNKLGILLFGLWVFVVIYTGNEYNKVIAVKYARNSCVREVAQQDNVPREEELLVRIQPSRI